MESLIKGIHHVTATTDVAAEDYLFYTAVLGMRFVKETVNFDNNSVYHFYYGNKNAEPSTIFTTFPYANANIRKGTIGSGQITQTYFSIPTGSLGFWKERLAKYQILVGKRSLGNSEAILFEDPSGLKLGLIERSKDNRTNIWQSEEIPEKNAIRGIDSVMLSPASVYLSELLNFLEIFGYQRASLINNTYEYYAESHESGHILYVENGDYLPRGVNGIGTIHHLAHRVNNITNSHLIKSALEKRGFSVTDIKDRNYFKSIYFRVPGGIIFEVATDEPGFTTDETMHELGSSLKLPEWMEKDRLEIKANLEDYREIRSLG
ncbi:MAG: VOC family protein [Balneolales bacterium]|nr:VOC family protein [Balneolales bacterium]